MALLEMGQMRNRYRLPRSRLAERARLDRIAGGMVDGLLDQALRSTHIRLAGEVCIRELDVSVRVRLSASDSTIAAAWSRSIAAAISEAVERSEGGIVTYVSARHALLDMASGVARGDASRAWAWSQLGMWRTSLRASTAAAIEELVCRLEDDATQVLPVLAELARTGLLSQLVGRLSLHQLARLARAAARLAGLELDGPSPVAWQTEPLLVDGGTDQLERAASEAPPSELAAAARSTIFRALGGLSIIQGSAEARHWAAILVMLAADPGMPTRRGPVVAGLVDAITWLIATAGSGITPAWPEADGQPGRRPSGSPNAATEKTGAASDDILPGDTRADGADALSVIPSYIAGDAETDVTASAKHSVAESGATAGRLRPASLPNVRPVSEPPPPDPRRRSLTAAGGLLFLVHLVERLDLPERLAEAPELQHRSLRWSLHRLALLTAGLTDDDPAALAFCGLGPDAPPPSRNEAPPSEDELTLLQAVTEELAQTLVDALGRNLEPPAKILAEICGRPAEVVAELGWIDIVLLLDDVSTEIRRAGLDIDPGWVPWLGIVLRFVYG